MPKQCELLDTCGFFKNYKGHLEVVKRGWIKLFCESEEKSTLCERKKIRLATGTPPADNMTPSGEML